MKQQTISDVEYSARKRKTKREEFLEIMDEIIPWEELKREHSLCYNDCASRSYWFGVATRL